MGADSDFDDDVDMDKILSELTEFDKSAEKGESRISKLSAPVVTPQQQKVIPGGHDENEEPEKEDFVETLRRKSIELPKTSRLPPSGSIPSPKLNRRVITTPTTVPQEQAKGNSLLASLFSDPPPRTNNQKPTTPIIEPKKPSPDPPIIRTQPQPTSGKSISNSDWLGLGSTPSSPLPLKKSLDNLDDEDDNSLVEAIRLGQMKGSDTSRSRQQAEKPLKPKTPDDIIPDRISGNKKNREWEQRQFEDKLTKGPSAFEDKFGAGDGGQEFQQPKIPLVGTSVISSKSVQPPSENEKKSFIQNLFGGKSGSSPVVRSTVSAPQVTEQLAQPEGQESSEFPEESVPKKKVMVVKKQAGNITRGNEVEKSISKSTLQVASHLIDEEELKTMSSSLKTLYANQLEMMEKSYGEQMSCMAQSHLRKEEVLKEEIQGIHKDYECKLKRLKDELTDMGNKTKLSQLEDVISNSGISVLAEQMKHLQNKIDLMAVQQPQGQILSTSLPSSNIPEQSHSNLIRQMDEVVEAKFSLFEKSLKKIIEEKLKDVDLQSRNQPVDAIHPEINKISSKLDKMEKERKHEIIKFGNSVADETANSLSSTIAKLSKVQRKFESVGENISQSISHQLKITNSKNEEKSKRFKQRKEFWGKLEVDMNIQNELIRKSNTNFANLSNEQKQMSQNLQEVYHWLQVNFTKNTILMNSQPTPSIQPELEMQMLKEERRLTSEVLAEMNVERIKQHEEKLAFEQEKREFERNRSRLNELQINLKSRTSDAEDLQNQAEASREENYRLGAELIRLQNELERDRLRQKESLRSVEENLRLQQESILRDRMEIGREREFLQRLRNQMLCPDCLKSLAITQPKVFSNESYNYNQGLLRSIGDGDGLDIQQNSYPQRFFSVHPIQYDDGHKETKLLDDLYFGVSK